MMKKPTTPEGRITRLKASAPTKRVKNGTSKAAATHRRTIFVEAYIANGGNALEAAKVAGCPPRSAHVAGARLLKEAKVLADIKFRREEALAKVKLNTDEVMESLARDIRFDPAKLFNAGGELKSIHEIDEGTRRALRGFEIENGRKKFKFPEVTAAREQAMKHFGLYGKDNSQRGDAAIRALMEAVGARGPQFDVKS